MLRSTLLAALLHVIPVPQPDVNATPPVSIEDAKDYCEAHGGQWNEYTQDVDGDPDTLDDDVSWFQCDEGTDAP